MSVKVSMWVWDHSESTGNARLVMLAIADEADDDGMNAYPGLERLASKTRIPKRTVMRCIERLQGSGELEVIRPDTPGRGRFNRYRVVMDAGQDDLGKGVKVTTFQDNPEPEKGAQRRAKARKGDTSPLPTSSFAEYPRPSTHRPVSSTNDQTLSDSLQDPVERETRVSNTRVAPKNGTAPDSRSNTRSRECIERTRAREIVNAWWTARTPRPQANYMGVVGVVEKVLREGTTPEDAGRALATALCPTYNAVKVSLAKLPAARSAPWHARVMTDRHGPPVEVVTDLWG